MVVVGTYLPPFPYLANIAINTKSGENGVQPCFCYVCSPTTRGKANFSATIIYGRNLMSVKKDIVGFCVLIIRDHCVTLTPSLGFSPNCVNKILFNLCHSMFILIKISFLKFTHIHFKFAYIFGISIDFLAIFKLDYPLWETLHIAIPNLII